MVSKPNATIPTHVFLPATFQETQEYVYKLINGEYGDISYYIRIWENEEWTTYDYGSHHTFFYIKRG